MDLTTIVHFLLYLLAVFAVLFGVVTVTPWLAKQVDTWIEKYRGNHTRAETYGIRSIYELPPKDETGKDETNHGKEE